MIFHPDQTFYSIFQYLMFSYYLMINIINMIKLIEIHVQIIQIIIKYYDEDDFLK